MQKILSLRVQNIESCRMHKKGLLQNLKRFITAFFYCLCRKPEVLGRWSAGKPTFFQKGVFPAEPFCNSSFGEKAGKLFFQTGDAFPLFAGFAPKVAYFKAMSAHCCGTIFFVDEAVECIADRSQFPCRPAQCGGQYGDCPCLTHWSDRCCSTPFLRKDAERYRSGSLSVSDRYFWDQTSGIFL